MADRYFESCRVILGKGFNKSKEISMVKIRVIILSYRLLRGVRWFETDVSGLHIGLIFKRQNILILEAGNDTYSRNVGFKSPYAA